MHVVRRVIERRQPAHRHVRPVHQLIGQPEYRRRLVMLGATPGATFEVIRVAPLGDPIELRVRGSAISVRRDEAEILEIEPIQ